MNAKCIWALLPRKGLAIGYAVVMILILTSQVWASWHIELSEAKAGGVNWLLLWKSDMGTKATKLSQDAVVALPSSAVAEIKVENALPWVGLQALEINADACQPRLSPPERLRDVYVATLSWTPCQEKNGQVLPLREARLRLIQAPGPRESPVLARPINDAAEQWLQEMLINYPASRQFRSQPPMALAKKSLADGFGSTSLPAIRLVLFTHDVGIHVIDYEALKKAGVPVDRLDTRYLRLWRDGREIPCFISGDEDGRIHRGDEIEFLGDRSHGDKTFYSPYSQESAFYLTWEGSKPGLRAPLIPVSSRRDAKPSPMAFQANHHAEEDLEILRAFSTAEENITDLGDRVQANDLGEFWFWTRQGPVKDVMNVSFLLPYAPTGGGLGETQGKEVRLRLQWKGITNDIKADPDHHLRFFLNGKDISLVDGKQNDAIWEGQNAYLWTSALVTTGFLKAGWNELTVQKVHDLPTTDGKTVETQDAYLNWLEVDFPARFAAVNGRARFANRFADSTGLRHFDVAGFQSENISLWDSRGRKLHGFTVRSELKSISLGFDDSLVGRVDYFATDHAQREKPRLRLDTLPDFINPSQGADWICITESPLLGRGLDSLVKHRQSQGLRTAVVQARHLYQAFGNGVCDPEALRRFLNYAYAKWPRPAPTYVLLLGETSLGFDKMGLAGKPNLVPTNLIDIHGWGVAANDDYFGKVTGSDEIPDLLVGRIPAPDQATVSHVVAKIIRQEHERLAGAWSNEALMIGGYEAGFTEGNARFQKRALELGRHTGRIDLFPKSTYYQAPSERRDFYRRLDSGLAFVQFFGHGGGSVWSDAGILTLQALDKDSLRGDWALPLISSITCLTGYFEDPYERSLGEEMLRRPRNGAAAFYGSSGYISTAAGQILGDEMVSAALHGGPTTVGALVHEAEMRVRQKTGSQFLPILAEFNLLGDPAMKYGLPLAREGLEIKPRFVTSRGEMRVEGQTQVIANGQAVLQVAQADSVITRIAGRVENKTWNQNVNVPAPERPARGLASLHVFSDTLNEVLLGNYAAADWLVDSIEMIPADAGYGDSVRLRISLATKYDSVRLEQGIAFFALGAESAPPFLDGNQRLLTSEEGRHFSTASAFVIPTPSAGGTAWPNLFVKLRLGLSVKPDGDPTLSIDETTPHAFALKPRPRLSLSPQALRLPYQDSLGLWIRFHNVGPGVAKRATLLVTLQAPDSAMRFTHDYSGNLEFGHADSVFIPLPDSALAYPLHVDLTPEHAADALPQALSADTNFQLQTRILRPGQDSMGWQGNPARIVRQKGENSAYRIFAKLVTLPALPTHLSAIDNSAQAIQLAISEEGKKFSAPLLLHETKEAAKISASSAEGLPQTQWHVLLGETSPWLRLDSAGENRATSVGAGLYAFLTNRDVVPPVISLQSRGQTLWPDDYVPQRTPIDILLEDGQGIDLVLSPPVLKSRGQVVDSSHLARDQGPASPTLARLRFTPLAGGGEDTLEITASDVSGNRLQRRFAYRMGDALAIRNLGSYPNPFADTAIFAYTLTDYCDEVSLTVYSRAGRVVRKLNDHRSVGYREVVWDGRTDAGLGIANGLYFLKVTANSGKRSSTAIFKLFKKRRL